MGTPSADVQAALRTATGGQTSVDIDRFEKCAQALEPLTSGAELQEDDMHHSKEVRWHAIALDREVCTSDGIVMRVWSAERKEGRLILILTDSKSARRHLGP